MTRQEIDDLIRYAEKSYWELRTWLDNHPTLEWVHGDDSFAYPYLRIAQKLKGMQHD